MASHTVSSSLLRPPLGIWSHANAKPCLWLTLYSFCFFILHHLCLVVRQLRAWLLPSLQRNNRLCDKGSPDSALETPNVQAGRSALYFIQGKRVGSFTRGAAKGVSVTHVFFLSVFFPHVFICSVYLSVSLCSPLSIYSSSRTLAQRPGRNVMQDIKASQHSSVNVKVKKQLPLCS